MAKKGTLVVRFIGDVKEFEQANKKMGTDLTKTGKAIDSSLTQPFGAASAAGVQVGKDYTDSARKMSTALSGTKKDIDSSLTKPLGDASKSIKGLGGDMSTEMGKFDSAVGGSKKELDQFKKDLDAIKKKTISPRVDVDTAKAEGEMKSFFSRMSTKAGEAGKETGSSFSDSMGISLKGGLAGVAAGAGVATAAGFLASMDAEASSDKLAASLGLSPEKAKQAGEVASKVYAGAWGDSLEDVNTAVGAVISSLPGMRNASDKALESATIKAEDFATAFDVDIQRAVQIAGQTVRQGFAKNASGAFDLLVKASQKVPAAVREDLLDAVDEYGPFFKTLGLSGEQSFGILAKGAEKGMYGIDKAGDAVKEFTIRATDGSDQTQTAFESIGLNSDKMSNAILAGGDTASDAFQKILQGLLDIKDPSERAQTALKLFGTPLEDLNVSEIPKFLKGLTETGSSLGKVEGASKRMGQTLNDNAKTNLTSFVRQLKIGFVQILGGVVIPKVREFSAWLSTNLGPTIQDITEAFKRNWPQIKSTVVGVLDEVGGAIEDFVELVRTVWAKWGDDITRIVKTNFGGLADFVRGYLKIFRGVVQTITALIKGDWGDVWKGIKLILSGVWQAMKALVGTYLKQIKNLIQTQWDAVKDIFSKTWDAIKGIVSRGFNAVRDVVKAGWNKIWGIFTKFVRVVVDKMLDFAGWLLDAADKAFGWIPGIGDKLDAAKAAFADFREGVNNQMKAINPSKSIELKIIPDAQFEQLVSSGAGHPANTGNRARGGPLGSKGGRLGRRMAMGGPVTGGTAGKDSVHILGMPDEHMWTTDEVRKTGGHQGQYKLRQMARDGLLKPMAKGGPVAREPGVVPKLVDSRQTLAETGRIFRSVDKMLDNIVMFVKQSSVFPAGRVGAALKWAKSQVGTPYLMGGVGPGAYDCSGFMSAITNFLRGNPLHSRVGSTASFPWSGFARGADPKGFTIGSTPSYPGSAYGHMAGTLGGVNVESSGGVGVRVGPGARGYNDPGFTQVYHLVGTKRGRGRGADPGAPARELMRRSHDTGGMLPPGGLAYNAGTHNEYIDSRFRPRRASGGSTRAVIEVDGQQLNAVIRDLVREEVHDEFAYQHGGI